LLTAGTAFAGELTDPLQTDAALSRDTAGWTDPLGRDCELPPGVLSFAAAVDLALCRNPQTRGAWAAARQQAAALGNAESAWLPDLTATGARQYVSGNHVDVLGSEVSRDQDTTDAAVNLSWTILDFGARTGRIRSARLLLEAQAATLNATAQQTVRNVVQAYYGVLAADALLEAAQTTEKVTGNSLEVARTLRDSGVGTQADLLQAQTANGQALLTRVQAEATAKTSRGMLSTVLGFTADQPLKIETDAVPSEVPALSARMADLMAEAMRQRPELAAARAQRDAAQADVSVARAAGLPVFSVTAGRNYAYTTDLPSQVYNELSLNVTVPLFSGFGVHYNVRQARAEVEAREDALEQAQQSVSLDVWNAYYTLDSANQQLTATASLNQIAESNEQVALGRYQSGVGSILDVLTAQTSAASARQLRINAELGWWVARAQLALALGHLTSAAPLTAGAALP
jgi:TolC family type I secretion outer membrane protein